MGNQSVKKQNCGTIEEMRNTINEELKTNSSLININFVGTSMKSSELTSLRGEYPNLNIGVNGDWGFKINQQKIESNIATNKGTLATPMSIGECSAAIYNGGLNGVTPQGVIKGLISKGATFSKEAMSWLNKKYEMQAVFGGSGYSNVRVELQAALNKIRPDFMKNNGIDFGIILDRTTHNSSRQVQDPSTFGPIIGPDGRPIKGEIPGAIREVLENVKNEMVALSFRKEGEKYIIQAAVGLGRTSNGIETTSGVQFDLSLQRKFANDIKAGVFLKTGPGGFLNTGVGVEKGFKIRGQAVAITGQYTKLGAGVGLKAFNVGGSGEMKLTAEQAKQIEQGRKLPSAQESKSSTEATTSTVDQYLSSF